MIVWPGIILTVARYVPSFTFGSKLFHYANRSLQIKNAVRTAQALAVNEKKPLCMEHIAKVLDVAETFEKDLKGGSGYEGNFP